MSQTGTQDAGPRRYRSEAFKITAILDFMASMDHNPKSFIISFLQIKNDQAAIQRRYWRTPRGWEGTLSVIDALRDFISASFAMCSLNFFSSILRTFSDRVIRLIRARRAFFFLFRRLAGMFAGLVGEALDK
ncbi:hypothetical protein PGTUg99_028008 [Puccinia graminis f. sp. tritici]|uniref:Uncharacterized protein n=1 Tax=Puccinia graminis f. sp. tritici TaxID=56615 RepID=A0A5B0SBV4_PUCGR|nr:hypothetical protein PGTUg99_028008 [Puccinia graminis f. sp. tritici]